MEFVIKNLFKNKTPGTGAFSGKFNKAFMQKIIPILYKHFQNTEEERILLNSSYEASITLIPKADKNITEKKKEYGHESS